MFFKVVNVYITPKSERLYSTQYIYCRVLSMCAMCDAIWKEQFVRLHKLYQFKLWYEDTDNKCRKKNSFGDAGSLVYLKLE
jgi:hypothetical protein